MNPAALVFIVTVTAPPLTPAEAVRVFTSSSQSQFVAAPPERTVPQWIELPRPAPQALPPPLIFNPPITFRVPKRGHR
jgi:hypothetical protein